MRKAGATYQQIASHLEYADPSGAYQAVKTALHLIVKEPATELLTLELTRLDDLLATLWQQSRNGDLRAMDRLLKVMERRAKMLGLDVPTPDVSAPTHGVTINIIGPDADIEEVPPEDEPSTH